MNKNVTPKELAVRWFEEVWNRRSADAIGDLMAADARCHMEGSELVGPEAFCAMQNELLEVFPDLEVRVLRAISEGDEACVLWEAAATHAGKGFGLEPTQEAVRFRGTTWFRIVDGRIVEGWDSWNQGGLLASLATADR